MRSDIAPPPRRRRRTWSVEGFQALWTSPALEVVAEVLTDDVIGHWAGRDEPVRGVDDYTRCTVARALAPYRETGRFVTFGHSHEVIPGVRAVDLAGHTLGHTGYLLGEDDATVLFWGDTVHCHSVQLRRPSVTMAADSDEPAAIAARRKALNLVSSNRWWVGAAHLPFPGLGHLRRDGRRYAWLPVTYAPVQ